ASIAQCGDAPFRLRIPSKDEAPIRTPARSVRFSHFRIGCDRARRLEMSQAPALQDPVGAGGVEPSPIGCESSHVGLLEMPERLGTRTSRHGIPYAGSVVA